MKANIELKKTYRASGNVWGALWGGGEGGYSARPIASDNRKELIKTAEKMLEDGSLDSGMGFECLLGAVLDVETVETLTLKNSGSQTRGKQYSRSEHELIEIGKLSEAAAEVLYNSI